MEITLALRQRDHCPGSGRSMPCPDVSATAPHPVLRRFRRDAASLQSGAASTTMLSRHTAFGCASAPPHRHYERER